ncbi:hypothetical protein AMTRI_Chr02g224070 [Amborella trichopoda]
MTEDKPRKCSLCKSQELPWLFNVKHKGTFCRLCTSCLLISHLETFCPSCFEVYTEEAPLNDGVKCSKCVSVSHSTCVSPECLPAYACAHCTNPNFPFTNNGDSNKKGWGMDGNFCSINPNSTPAMNLSTAKVIVAAAEISSLSMNRIAMAARGEADRRAMDSSIAKRRARDALVKSLELGEKEDRRVQKEKEEKDKHGGVSSSTNAILGTQSCVKMEREEKQKPFPAYVVGQQHLQNHVQPSQRSVPLMKGSPSPARDGAEAFAVR